MMDIEQVTRTAITNTFNTLIDEGYSPSMEFEGDSLTIWTEDASAEFVAIINRKRTGLGSTFCLFRLFRARVTRIWLR